MAFNVHQEVTDQIIKALEAGTPPWVQPYSKRPGANIPCNAISNRPYSGINVVLFWISSARGYSRPRFLTYKQAVAKGGFVKKGEKGMMLVYASKIPPKKGAKDKDGKPSKGFFMMKTYTVFNVAQCENLPDEVINGPVFDAPNKDQRNESADKFIVRTGANIQYGGSQPCYIPSRDIIQSPSFEDYHNDAAFYATMFHELAHWTGAKSRLDRDKSGSFFGNVVYAAEELVAELSAAIIAAEFGYDVVDNSASYIKGWLKALNDDPKAIFKAASAASKAVDFLKGNRAEEEIAEAA